MSYSDEQRALAACSPAGLAVATSRGRWKLARHLDFIDELIVDAVAGRAPQRLIVPVPPRHGKSELISRHTPPWFLGNFPDRRVMLASYEARFASSWGRKARDLIEEHGDGLYGVRVRQDARAAEQWELDRHEGGMASGGVGGPFTGKGADLMIIDDPVKNAEEAMSEVMREKQWDWWQSTANTRLHPGAVVVVLMTRWHADDLAGRLLAGHDADDPLSEPWTEIRLPALAEANDPLGRKVGEALWPERFPVDWLERKRREVGPYWFAAMYQGTPVPDGGGIFRRDWFRHYDRLDDDNVSFVYPDGHRELIGLGHCRHFQMADLAVSEKETADFTVIGEFAVTPNGDLIVLNVTRERVPGPDQPAMIRARYDANPRCEWIGVEQIGYQLSLIQTLVRDGLPVRPMYPDKDKVARASTAGVRYSLGKVWHPRTAPWLHDLEHELLAFPVGSHDDQVDVIAYAARAQGDVGGHGRGQQYDGDRPRPVTRSWSHDNV